MGSTEHEALRDFFRSEDMLAFVDAHCLGDRPWAAVWDGQERIVLADHERRAFHVLDQDGDHFTATVFDDAIQMVDPESESGNHLGSFDSPEQAFLAATEYAGLSSAPRP